MFKKLTKFAYLCGLGHKTEKKMKNSKYKSWLPYLLTVALFFVLAAVYFAPQYQGMTLNMHDDLQYKGMSQDIRVHNELYDEDPQWTGNAFGGMPSYLNSIKYPSMIIREAGNALMHVVGNPTWMIFMAMCSFWIMLLLWGINPWVAIAPAIAYGFSTYSILIIGAGHLAKMLTFAYAPLLMGAVVYTFRSRHMLLGSMLAALSASLMLAANHPQITYYFVIIIAAYWINELVQAIKNKTLPHFGKATGMLILAAVLAVGSNLAPLYYTIQHSPDTTRGGSELAADSGESDGKGLDLAYATAWSYGKAESFNMFIPDFMGGATGAFESGGEVSEALKPYGIKAEHGAAYGISSYWGKQPGTAGPTYIGAVVIFLAVMGLFVLQGRTKWWILAVSIFALLLAWGNNLMWFTELAFKLLPGYNKFRAVATTLVIVQWSLPLLAALTLAKIYNTRNNATDKATTDSLSHGLKWSLIITGGLALFFMVAGKSLFAFSGAYDSQLPEDIAMAMQTQRASMLTSDAFRSLLFVLLSASTVFFFMRRKLSAKWFVAIFAILVCVDMIPVDMRFLPHSKFVEKSSTEITPTAIDIEILKDKEPGYRVANIAVSTFNDATTSYFHRSVGGYHGAKLQRYQDIIDHYLGRGDLNIYNLLNTKYFIMADPETGALTYQQNPDANGAAWFVESIDWVQGAGAEIDLLGKIDNKTSAVADEKFRSQVGDAKLGDGIISLMEYYPNRLTYEYESKEGGVAVFSEIFYDKGWTAYIDGNEAPYFRADYILRAMYLPAGNHNVEFRFRAPNFNTVSALTLTFSLLILAGLAASIIILLRDNKKNDGTSRE